MVEMTIREMASLGGKARAAKLTKARRKEIGKKAVAARWSKQRAHLEAVTKEIREGTKALLKTVKAKQKKHTSPTKTG